MCIAEFCLAPSFSCISTLTLGIVGQNTDYKGDILLDHMRFTQVIAEDIYVDSTVKVKKGDGIVVSEDGRSLTTASKNTVVPHKAYPNQTLHFR